MNPRGQRQQVIAHAPSHLLVGMTNAARVNQFAFELLTFTLCGERQLHFALLTPVMKATRIAGRRSVRLVVSAGRRRGPRMQLDSDIAVLPVL
ncbi:hypothetical protein WJ63_06935 [Burkholderia pyrrocinia]|nr:hypothetical protein WJ63_06935 [Burkholderia pyrrocinia]